MESRNGFYQLHTKPDGTYLRLFPPIGDGRAVNFEEISSYLNDLNILDYNINELGQGIDISATNKVEVKILSIVINPVNESLKLRFSADRMYAIGRFYPPSLGGKTLNYKDIELVLKRANIVHGIVIENIEYFLKTRRYCEDIILARGTKPVEGRDAKITYHFNTDNTLKPKVNEDGTVDFHQLDMISKISKGDILATLEPALSGTPGMDLYGNKIPPRKVNRKILRHGKDIHLSEDGLTMYSDVSGHVILTEDRVFVSNTYEVLGDVDSSTGDIDYDGNVTVKGNVITGFSIYAKGDIIVNGVVEGARLRADGHIILKRGMQGMSKGVMEAKGNIITKFIENASVHAGGYVTTEAILHSKVSAKGEITVGGKKGFITGGEIRSGSAIIVKTAGSTMGTQTLLEVGTDPSVMEEYRELEKVINQKQADLDRLLPIVDSYKKKLDAGEVLTQNKVDYIKIAAESCISLRYDLKELIKQYEMLQLELNNNENAYIKVENVAYPGVKIVISNVIYYVRSQVHYSRFIRDKADIKVVGL